MTHCLLLQQGEIQTIVGDASRNGHNGPQYCGLWSLTSVHRVYNAFGNSYAGLIPSEMRGKNPSLESIDENSCLMKHQPSTQYPVSAQALYRVVAPYYIEHQLTFRDLQDMRLPGCTFREVIWCSYMNSPEDSRIHFLSSGEWFRYISPCHGTGSNIAPSYVPESELEVWPKTEGRRPFHWDRIHQRFDQPFYYGRLGDMLLLFVFDTPRWLRFYCSPTGGGGSLIPGCSSPAWDFEWVIPESRYRVGESYRFRVGLVYKRYVSDEDVLQEVETTRQMLHISEDLNDQITDSGGND